MIPQKDKSIRVLIVEDHPIMRDGLRSSLEQEPDIRVIGTTGRGDEAIKLALKKQPDVVVMDIGLPDKSGMEAAREIREKAPKVQVIALTVRSDSESIHEMLKAGALGFLSKESFCKDLVSAIHSVVKGERYLSKDVAQVVYEVFAKPRETDSDTSVVQPMLTRRQAQILKLMRESWSTKEMGQHLGISPKTVAMHRSRLMKRLGITKIADLLKYAILHQL